MVFKLYILLFIYFFNICVNENIFFFIKKIYFRFKYHFMFIYICKKQSHFKFRIFLFIRIVLHIPVQRKFPIIAQNYVVIVIRLETSNHKFINSFSGNE